MDFKRRFDSLWDVNCCQHKVKQDEEFIKSVLSSLQSLEVSEAAVRFTPGEGVDYSKLKSIGIVKICEMLKGLLCNENFSFKFDKQGLLVTVTGPKFAVMALSLTRLVSLSGIPVVGSLLVQRFTKRILLHDIEEDLPAKTIAQNLCFFGRGQFVVQEVFRQRVADEGALYKGSGVFVTYVGSAEPDKVFLCHMDVSFKPLYPRALQCSKCQRFGHSQKFCRGTARCAECGGNHDINGHSLLLQEIELMNHGKAPEEFTPLPKISCVLCKEKGLTDIFHRANDRKVCPQHKSEAEINKYAYINSVSRQDALKHKGRLRTGVSFASVTQGPTTDTRLGGLEESVKAHDRYVRQLIKAVTDLAKKAKHPDAVSFADEDEDNTTEAQTPKMVRPAAGLHPAEPLAKKSAKRC